MSNSLPAAAGLGSAAARPGPSVRRGAKAFITSGSRVLLVRERHADGRGFWTLPGGGARPREPLTDAVRRELDEELDCVAVVGSPVSRFWYAHVSRPSTVSVYTVFDCAVASEVNPVRSEGVLESRWVDPDRPPARTLPQVRHILRDHEP
ncbi:MAG: NUDIX hydrolase [Halobacteriota archaeon]